ncbi:MAG: amidohydrolase family protein [Clostridia bacterium]|nr:amidohydrolase family protein [Clostridia bacterium]
MSAKLSKYSVTDETAPRYTLITNVRLLDPLEKNDEVCDILLKKEVGASIPTVEAIGKGLRPSAESLLTIQGAGLCACRSFVDLHTHTCDPGNLALEDIRSAGEAAAWGGYGDALILPYAPIDWTDEELLDYLNSNFRSNGSIDFQQAFYLTRQNRGQELSDLEKLSAAGIRFFYEEGFASPALLFQGMERIATLGGVLVLRCNIPTLCPNGTPVSKGASIAAETAPLAAALAMAEVTGCRIHITPVSTAASVELIRTAKAKGVAVTCDTAPQYFIYDDRELLFQGSAVKVDPPLRKSSDKQAILRGLADGTIDCIACDHTPVSAAQKAQYPSTATPGMLGLQTAFGLALRELHAPDESGTPLMDLHRIVELFTTAPAKILGLPERVEVGALAKLILLDLQTEYTFTAGLLKSKSKNCPWIEQRLRGRVKYNFAKIQKDTPKRKKS